MAGAPPRALLVRLPNPLGDVVMALPLLTVLRAAWPETRLVACGAESLAPLFADRGALDLFLPLKPEALRGAGAIRRQAAILRAARADAGLILPNSWSSALAALLAGIPRRIGRRGGGRALLLSETLPPIPAPAPMTELYGDFLAPLGLPRPRPLPPARLRATLPPPPPLDRAGSGPWLAVAPGAAFGPSKIYPDAALLEVVARAGREHGLRPVWIGGPDEAPRLRALATAHAAAHGGPTAVVCAGLGEALAALAASRALLAMDNGARHLAAALGVPQVAVYGPTHPAWSAHALEGTVVVRHENLPCLACHCRRCPLPGHPCMSDLPPAAVAAALAAALLAPRPAPEKAAGTASGAPD